MEGKPGDSEEIPEGTIVTSVEEGSNTDTNADDERLAGMGYKPQLNREFGLLSCMAFGYSVSFNFVCGSVL